MEILAIFRFALLLAICAACPLASAGADKGPITVTLRVQGLPNDAATDPASIAEQKVVAAFLAAHPDIAVVPAEGLKITSLNSEASTILMIAGGIAPDVIRMNFRSSDTYIRQGIVTPLNEFLDLDPAPLSIVPSQVLPVIQKSNPGETPKIYGLPLQLVVSGLYFNRELFRKAGLPQRPPRNWEEMLAFARKIQSLHPDYHGLFLQSGASASFTLMNFIRAAGGDAVKEIAEDEWRADFNSPGALNAYLLYYRIVAAERLAYRSPGKPKEEMMDKVGMFFRYIGDSSPIDPEVWGFGAVPVGPSGHGGSEINAGILSIFSGVTDPARKRAAWEYIRFVTSDEAEHIRCSALVDLGMGSLINPETLRKFGFTEYLIMTPPGLEEEMRKSISEGRPEPYGKNCNLIYSEMGYPLDQILLSVPIKKAWAKGDETAVQREAQAILDRAVARTNERMIGYVSPQKMKVRRLVAAGVVIAVVISFIFVGRAVTRAFAGNSALVSRPLAGRTIVPWLCLLPAAALVLTWNYLPLIRGTQIAFQDYQILLESSFVGLDNFANVLFNQAFWNSLLATLHFAAWTLTIGFVAPILLAYILHLIPRYKVIYRTLYYLPAVISGTAVFFLWKELFDTEGILNQVLRFAGFEANTAWTENPHLAMLSCVIPGIWAGVGPGCLIYLAALKTVPEEQFEASEIDGAGFWSKTLNVVYPNLRALIVINFIGAVTAAFHGATNVLIMTGGGPNGRTEVASLLIFFEAFARLKFGTATAMAWIIGSMLVGFTVLQVRRLSRMEFRTAK